MKTTVKKKQKKGHDGEGMFDRLLRIVQRIPQGKVATYGGIAKAAGYPGAARQVAWALRRSHGLPWHRVVGTGGRLCLQGAAAIEQRLRLEREQVAFVGRRVAIERHGWPKSKESYRGNSIARN